MDLTESSTIFIEGTGAKIFSESKNNEALKNVEGLSKDLGREKLQKGGFFFFFLFAHYSTLLHLPRLRFHCVGGCCNRLFRLEPRTVATRTQDSCDSNTGLMRISAPLPFIKSCRRDHFKPFPSHWTVLLTE
jgi:hypothetical protein